MIDVKLKVDSTMLADYLAWLFPPLNEGGPLKISTNHSLGKLLVAHCHIDERSDRSISKGSVLKAGRNKSTMVTLDLPNDAATKPLIGKWLWYPPADTAALNMALKAVFDIDFNMYYLRGIEMGHQKKDIVTAFIVSRGLFSTDCFDSLHKRVYRRSQQLLDSLTKQLIRKAYYINSTINLKGLNDD